ncbi:MAG: cell envelope integrity protein TolA [Arenicellales bacterium]|nr:cell envelope integrity protein TolA [Arenicellales bacterium]
MNRAVRKFSRPVRAVILAVLVHVAFGLLLGLSLSFKPQVIKPSIAKPVKAIVIDRSTITQEETNKKEAEKKRKQEAEKKRKQEAEKKRKKEAEKKRKAEAEKKRKKEAETKRKKEAEKKRKKEAEKKRKKEAEKKRKAQAAREQEKQDAYSALGSLVGAIKGKIEGNWSNRLACSGQEVTISVKVNVSGEVTAVKVVGDSGDDACRRSAENAVYKASPLPFPDNPRFFKWLDQEFQIIFKPDI